MKFIKKNDTNYIINPELRLDTFKTFKNIFNNSQKSLILENSIYEFAILYGCKKQCEISLLQAIYIDKKNVLDELLTKNNVNYCDILLQNILNDVIEIHTVPFLSPQELDKSKWKLEMDKKEYKEYIKNNHETTSAYRCRKCHERKSKVWLMQTRSCDEPMTTFILCQVCGFLDKK